MKIMRVEMSCFIKQSRTQTHVIPVLIQQCYISKKLVGISKFGFLYIRRDLLKECEFQKCIMKYMYSLTVFGISVAMEEFTV